jgi:type IV secretion system protein VirB6
VVSELSGGAVDMTTATVFVAACIHCALMAMVLKMTSTLTSGWRCRLARRPRPPGPNQPCHARHRSYAAPAPPTIVPMIQSRPVERDERLRSVVAAVNAPHQDIMPETSARILTMPGVSPMMFPSSGVIPATSPRARDIGRGMSACLCFLAQGHVGMIGALLLMAAAPVPR